MKVIWSPRALERVVETGEYIAQEYPDAAHWVERIFASVARLRRFPNSGRSVPERQRDDLREIVHEGYRVIYRIDPDQVTILTVRQSRLPITTDDPELR